MNSEIRNRKKRGALYLWIATCSPKEFVDEGYKRLTGPTPEEIADALEILQQRTKVSEEIATAYMFCFDDKRWYEAINETSLFARAAECAKEFKG